MSDEKDGPGDLPRWPMSPLLTDALRAAAKLSAEKEAQPFRTNQLLDQVVKIQVEAARQQNEILDQQKRLVAGQQPSWMTWTIFVLVALTLIATIGGVVVAYWGALGTDLAGTLRSVIQESGELTPEAPPAPNAVEEPQGEAEPARPNTASDKTSPGNEQR